MPKIVRLVAAAALVPALLPQGASAVLGSSCGGPHNGSGQCSLVLAGPVLSVQGSGVSIVVVALSDGTGTITFLSCYSQRQAAQCGAFSGFGLTGPMADLPAGVPLTCYVFSNGAGEYSCTSSTS